MANDTDALWSGWMAAAQEGDAEAYHALMRVLQPWLRNFFARRVPAVWLDDLVQETLLAVHSRRHTSDPAQPFLPWLRAIARYKWIDRLRHPVKDRRSVV